MSLLSLFCHAFLAAIATSNLIAMPSTRKTDDHDEQTPSKRIRASREPSQDLSDEDYMPRRRGRSQVRRTRVLKPALAQPVRAPLTPIVKIMSAGEESSDESDQDIETYEPISRIRTAISYTRAQIRKQLHPNQTTASKYH
jgi:hypothetical protein